MKEMTLAWLELKLASCWWQYESVWQTRKSDEKSQWCHLLCVMMSNGKWYGMKSSPLFTLQLDYHLSFRRVISFSGFVSSLNCSASSSSVEKPEYQKEYQKEEDMSRYKVSRLSWVSVTESLLHAVCLTLLRSSSFLFTWGSCPAFSFTETEMIIMKKSRFKGVSFLINIIILLIIKASFVMWCEVSRKLSYKMGTEEVAVSSTSCWSAFHVNSSVRFSFF